MLFGDIGEASKASKKEKSTAWFIHLFIGFVLKEQPCCNTGILFVLHLAVSKT